MPPLADASVIAYSPQSDVYFSHMKRTQIYITEQQDERLAALAADRQVSKAQLIREIIDQALDIDVAEEEARAIIEETAGICADYPDWPEWLDRVRGDGADARLRSLGL